MVRGDEREDELLRRGLEAWRERKHWAIRQRLAELAEIYLNAAERLEFMREFPEASSKELEDFSWEEIRSAIEEGLQLTLEYERFRLMEPAELERAFKHRKYEIPVWDFWTI